MESSTRDNHDRGKVGDFLKEHVAPNSELLSLHSLLFMLTTTPIKWQSRNLNSETN